MRIKLGVIFLLLACLLPGKPGWAGAEDEQERPWRVGKVIIEGAENINTASIIEVMENKPSSAFTFLPAPEFSYLAMERDRESISNLYKMNGYFNVRVRVSPGYRHETRLVDVTVTVRENDLFHIRQAELILPKPEDEVWRGVLWEMIGQEPGQPMLMEAYSASKDAILTYMTNHAHPLMRMESQVLIYRDTHEAVPRFLIDPGPEIKFGQAQIINHSTVKDNFILERLTFIRGEAFSSERLKDSQQVLSNSGVFSSVTLTPVYDQKEGDEVPIAVEVYEAAPHSLALGLGYGTEENFRVQVSQVNRNMLGLGDIITVSGKYSSLYLGLSGNLGIPLYSRHALFDLYGGARETDNESYSERSFFISPSIVLTPDDNWKFILGLKTLLTAVTDLEVKVPDPDYELSQHIINSFVLSAAYDTRDSALAPGRGWLAQLELEASSQALASNVAFIKAAASFSHIIPLIRDRWSLAWRAEYGIIMPMENTSRIPLVSRFFPGGSQSVRGYRYQNLGPLDGSGKPLGGESMVEASLELRFPLWGDLGGVLFVDAGNAYENYTDYSDGLRFTAGAGLRYNTPLGPIRVDLGYILNRPDYYSYEDYQFYLSVGQAF
ncbi:MAG: BamA/TamA family outer membrane protein [Desulfarculales bacterium]|jgi:outer membrane protein assembly complex protein YaeT|nr:BamA/TamA family outer membrane protein [Desulfarculales bacterium]